MPTKKHSLALDLPSASAIPPRDHSTYNHRPPALAPLTPAASASVALHLRSFLSKKHLARAPTRTPSYSDKMLRLNLARNDSAHPRRSVFDPSYSPDGSESSSSSRRSRSPSPQRRRMSPSPARIAHTRSGSHGIPVCCPLPRCHTHPSDLSAAVPRRRPSRNCNEEVLRSRLEGVLSSASSSRDVSCPPSPQRRRAATSGEPHTYGLVTPPHTIAHPLPPAMTRSKTSPAVSRSSRPSTTHPSPITPPPSPPFDANQISLQLREREGYVSFADVQGLGVPHSTADEGESDPERGRGRWWTLWKG